ncbi:MAG: TetR/AcrR family transcriptional regulator [Thermodesulfobacteriota bacterium]|nr:TetR/AcrR family transcriptional regulator [Thermodesulfobacteriota bacterium]
MKGRKQQAVRLLIERFSREGRPEALLAFFESRLARAGSPAQVLEEALETFREARKVIREAGAPVDLPLSSLLDILQQAVGACGVAPETFYRLVARQLLDETEANDGARELPSVSTREKILDAALELFSVKGFHQATVDEIADRAGVGKGTLYRYFSNKEALFHELVQSRLKDLERQAEAVLDGQDDVLTMIRKYLRIYFEFFDKNQRFYRVMVQEHPEFGERVQDLYIEKILRRIPLLKRKVYEARQRGVLRDVTFNTTFYGVMGFIHGVIQRWLAHDCSYPLMEELPAVEEVLFYGFVQQRERESEPISVE